MAEYENIELIVYAEAKATFESMVQSGAVTTSQIGLIGDTGEVWIDGEYYPFAPQGSGSTGDWGLSFNVEAPTGDATKYTIQQGDAQLDILVPEIVTSANSYLSFVPTFKTIQLGDNDSEDVVSRLVINAKVKTLAEASGKDDGLATANDIKTTLSNYVTKEDSVGMANDLTGVLQPTAEEFAYRPTANNKSVRDESAVIRTIKGNSIIWSQKIESIPTRENFEGATTFYDAATNEIVIQNLSRSANYTSGSTRWQIKPDLYPTVGHKYLLLADRYYKGVGIYIGSVFTEVNKIFTPTLSSLINFRIDKTFDFVNVCPQGTEVRLRMCLFDLTEMFGAGNEPTTVEAFRALYPLSYYAYSEPTIKGMSAHGIKTVGFNNFSSARAKNGILTSDGTTSSSYVYYVDTFKVLPNTDYWLKDVANGANTITYAIYNSSMTKISTGRINIGSALNVSSSVKTPYNAAYMAVVCHKDYLGSCCVNLRHSRIHDGEYHDYEEHTLSLPEVGKYFPKGMQGVGGVYDEISSEGVIIRFNTIHLQSLEWSYDSAAQQFFAGLPTTAGLHAMCDTYTKVDKANRALADGEMCIVGNRNIFVKDTNYSDVESFLEHIATSLFVYQRGEPIYADDDPIQLSYWANDWGTEEALSNDVSTPFKADIVYAFNAEGRIRDNERNIERIEEDVQQIKAPYIIQSFCAGDFASYQGTLLMDISPNDLLGGEISKALSENRPVFIKTGDSASPMRGVCAMQYCYEDDFIYFSFLYEGMEYYGEIDYNEVRYSSREARVDVPTEIASATPIMYIGANTASISPNIMYWIAMSMESYTLPTLVGGSDGYDNKWMIRFSLPTSANLTINDTIVWKDGIAPSFDTRCLCELVFFKFAGTTYGEWKIYK